MSVELPLSDKDIFALYHLPGESDYHLIHQLNKNDQENTDWEEDESGFVFHPFLVDERFPLIFIKAEKTYINPVIRFRTNRETHFQKTEKDTYFTQVRQFINLTRKEYSKLVLSRIDVLENNDQDVFQLFLSLRKQYPNAFTYLLNHPRCGTWMGASPELFLEKRKNTFETVSLAGTRILDEKGLKISPWTEKEKDEQAIVSNYIMDTLNSFGLSFKLEGPVDEKAGRLVHLKTRFLFSSVQVPVKKLADSLHPTPAVCGIPKDKAKLQILESEEHDRAYYTGFLGPVNIDNKTVLFVNLRCLQLSKSQFVLYLGGGITSGSVAEAEWMETVHKAGTMLKILQTEDN